jgi:hypothetical protein
MKAKQLITIPRILGIILIILAVIIYRMQQPVQSALLAIAGIILLLAPKKSAKENLNALIASFKLKKEFAVIMFIDAVLAIACALLSVGLYRVITSNAEKLRAIPLGPSMDAANLASYNGIISSFFTASLAALIIFYVVMLAVYTIARGLIWLVLLDKPVRFPFLARFGLVNLLWCTLWVIAAGFFLAVIKSPLAVAVIFILMILAYTHLTTILHYAYTKKREFATAFKDAFGTGIGSITKFALQYCYVFIVYVLLSQILRFATGKMLLVAAFLLFFAFMAWYRIYMRNTLRKLI